MEQRMMSTYFDIMVKARKVYARHLEPVCKTWSLTSNELDVLLFLYNNPSFDRAADIVTRRGIAKSHVSLSVSSLEDRGLLRRSASTSDRRTVHLALTEEGTAIAREARRAQKGFFSRMTQELSPEELRQWADITEKIRHSIEVLAAE